MNWPRLSPEANGGLLADPFSFHPSSFPLPPPARTSRESARACSSSTLWFGVLTKVSRLRALLRPCLDCAARALKAFVGIGVNPLSMKYFTVWGKYYPKRFFKRVVCWKKLSRTFTMDVDQCLHKVILHQLLGSIVFEEVP
jgi:hypothetical protein